MLTNVQAATIERFGTGPDRQARARQLAGRQFDRLHAQALNGQRIARLFSRSLQLRRLPGRPRAGQHTTGVVLVPLNRIVGSEGRSADFDIAFRPLNPESRERWVSVAAARRAGIGLPPVELLQDGEHYFVRDGHHRVSVARAAGQDEIEARVVNG
jgi:hypothetical protein